MTQTELHQAQSLLSNHLISQINSNLDVLLSQSLISRETVDAIKQKLQPVFRSVSSPHVTQPVPEVAHPLQSPASNQSLKNPGPPAPGLPVPLSPQLTKQAKAIWAYHGSAPDDLSFERGDIILVLSEENEDWWKGKLLNSSQTNPGLFPSNHVELVPASESRRAGDSWAPSSTTPQVQQPSGTQGAQYHPPTHHSPYPPAQHAQYSQPPGSTWPAPYGSPQYQGDFKQVRPMHPPPPPLEHSQSAPPVQINVEKPKKKPLQGRFGQALVGGAGFGAGSAVASHVVNAIL